MHWLSRFLADEIQTLNQISDDTEGCAITDYYNFKVLFRNKLPKI